MTQPSAEQMRQAVRRGQALPAPGQDRPGRFPIRNRADLQNAIRAVGRVQPPTEQARVVVRRFILRRARQLSAMDLIPETWRSDGSLRD